MNSFLSLTNVIGFTYFSRVNFLLWLYASKVQALASRFWSRLHHCFLCSNWTSLHNHLTMLVSSMLIS